MKKLLLTLALVLAAPPSLADTVCSIGDSITAGARRLRTKLHSDYHPGWAYVGNYFDGKWYHDGVAGDTSSGVVRRLGTLPECDLALVMIGTNDFPWITADRTLANLQSIVDYLRSRGTRV